MFQTTESDAYICCEDCEVIIPASEAAPDGLCRDCYAERLISDEEEQLIRGFLHDNRTLFSEYVHEQL
ncbi:MAG: hypothetical protein II773_03445 [Oscillospiraceae bacterium]|nr:hypothetical protein [Oscillospiraceae bacterium]MCR5166289.1 hypothetical protein [Oscillospiraceae bacterium]